MNNSRNKYMMRLGHDTDMYMLLQQVYNDIVDDISFPRSSSQGYIMHMI